MSSVVVNFNSYFNQQEAYDISSSASPPCVMTRTIGKFGLISGQAKPTSPGLLAVFCLKENLACRTTSFEIMWRIFCIVVIVIVSAHHSYATALHGSKRPPYMHAHGLGTNPAVKAVYADENQLHISSFSSMIFHVAISTFLRPTTHFVIAIPRCT